ncbi:MAG: hypothetical protein ACOYH4_03645 [Saccharofermentanales bacterium]
MAFSMEAMVAIPCCLSLFLHTTGLAGPLAFETKRTGLHVARARMEVSETGQTCRHYVSGEGEIRVPAVETHPQRVVEALALARDILRTAKPPEKAGLP